MTNIKSHYYLVGYAQDGIKKKKVFPHFPQIFYNNGVKSNPQHCGKWGNHKNP